MYLLILLVLSGVIFNVNLSYAEDSEWGYEHERWESANIERSEYRSNVSIPAASQQNIAKQNRIKTEQARIAEQNRIKATTTVNKYNYVGSRVLEQDKKISNIRLWLGKQYIKNDKN